MAIEAGHKVIPSHSKFTSELDPGDPADRKEMNARVFGRDYRTDRNGKPIDVSRGTDAFWISDSSLPEDEREAQAKLRLIRDTFNAHIKSLMERGPTGGGDPSKGPYIEAADTEKARINELRRQAGLRPLPF